LGNWYIKRKLCTYSSIWTWFLGMQMHATFILKCSKCRLCMQQCNAMKNCTMFMTFFLIFVILILVWSFFLFLWRTQIDCLFLERCDNSCNLILSFANLFGNSFRVYVLFNLVTWQFWSYDNGAILTFNQSTEILILGFSPFFLKTSIILHNKRNIRFWDQSHAPLKDGNGLLHFGIW